MKQRILITFALLIAWLGVSGQVYRVTIADPAMPSRTTCIDLFEFDYVDVQPKFPGGERGLINYINSTREYPYHAYHNKVQGRVLCSFIIGPEGEVSNVSVLRGAGDKSLDREAVRVISKMPKWKSGKMNGSPVYVHCILPIAFRL